MGAAAGFDDIGIAEHDADRLKRQLECVRGNLGEARLVPLARWTGEHVEAGIARLAELDRRLLLRRRAAAARLDQRPRSASQGSRAPMARTTRSSCCEP
jgi:hypothetical protein